MALQFPSSASIGQTYQSGSSPIYTYNGSVWALSAGNVGISMLNAYTASLRQALQTTGSNATMLGNLSVQGTQTALNQSSLQISDKTIRIASGSLTSTQANGAGILIDGANVTMSWDSTNSLFNMGTQLSASKFYGDGSGLTGVSSYTNSDNLAYLNSKGVISGSSQLSGTTIPNLSGSFTGSLRGDVVGSLSGTALYASNVAVVTTNTTNDSTLYPVFTNTSASNANNTLKNHPSGTFYYDGITRKVYGETFVGSIEATNGVISGSSQLTSSYDLRYTISGSVANVNTASLVTSITNLNTTTASLNISITNLNSTTASLNTFSASLDSRYLTIGGDNVISGSSQLTSSFDTRYALSGSGGSATIPAGTVSGSSQLTSSYDGRYLLTQSFNSFTASAQTVTTGSNSFNGTQTITGSLVITSGSFIGSQIVANTSSLYLTSGSNMYVQNNGVVEITGSLTVSGSSTFKNNLIIGTGSAAEGGQIDLAYAQSGNTTLTGSSVSIDVYADKVRIFENAGNNRGVSIDLSKAPTSVGGDLMWKTSGLINTGSFVQLDNIKAGPTRTGAGGGYAGLSIGAVSTSFVADVSAVYSNTTVGGQTITGTTYTTTAANSWNGWGFLQGQQSTYIVNDTTNSRVYRITLMIGASYNNNFVSIERLY